MREQHEDVSRLTTRSFLAPRPLRFGLQHVALAPLPSEGLASATALLRRLARRLRAKETRQRALREKRPRPRSRAVARERARALATETVVNSSATVGWMPTTSIISAYVRPFLSAIASPCVISPAFGPR